MRPVSWMWLGWSFAKRLLARLISARAALPASTAYGGDDAALASLSRCIACGACDTRFDAYGRVAAGTLRAPSELVLATSRAGAAWDALAAPLAELARGDLVALEAVCPARIPFREVVRVAKRRAEAPRAASAALPRSTTQHDPG